MDSRKAEKLRVVLGFLERNFELRFREILTNFAQLFADGVPSENHSDLPHPQKVDITSYVRPKRNPFRALLSILRIARPARSMATAASEVASISSKVRKVSKFARFYKVVKNIGIAATYILVPFEIASAFGLFEDNRYEALSLQLEDLRNQRVKELSVLGNITLATTHLNDIVTDINQEFRSLLIDTRDFNELSIQGSILLSSYLTTIQTSLNLLLMGKIPSTILSLDNQRTWVEKRIPRELQNRVSTITPHLKISLKGVDEEKSNLFITIDVPRINARVQDLDFFYWEPKFIVNETCYSSGTKELLIGYSPSVNPYVPITKPLIFTTESCLTEGYILCESDSLLDMIPGLREDSVCTERKEITSNRFKRDSGTLYYDALKPHFDITPIVDRSLRKNSMDLNQILVQIQELKDENLRGLRELEELRKSQSSFSPKALFLTVVIGAAFLIFISAFIFYFLYKKVRNVRESIELSRFRQALTE